jgi:aldose 1-epimerase
MEATIVPLVLERGALRVELWPALGGRIASVRWRGAELLRTAPSPEQARREPFFWSGFPMAPWCNRVPRARLATADGELALPVTWEDGSALHGEVFERPWHVRDGAHLSIDGGGFGFPWRYRVEAEVSMEEDSLRYELTLINHDEQPMPAGLGWHPWFAADAGTLELHIPFALAYDQDEGYLPVGPPRPLGADDVATREWAAPAWGTHALYTAPREHVVGMRWPRRDVRAELSFAAAADHLLVFALEPADAIAIEPQTHAPDGHRRTLAGEPGGIATLAPSERLCVAYTLRLWDEPTTKSS